MSTTTTRPITAKVMTVTPEIAKGWLANNTNFRRIRDARVDRMAHLMKKGLWDLNGGTIKLNGDGSLKDGQHRLAAIVRANRAIKSVVVFGIASDLHVDVGKARTFGEWLTYHEEKNAYQLAAAIRFVWNYRNGVFKTKAISKQMGPAHRELVEFLRHNPKIRSSVTKGHMYSRMLPSSVYGGLHFLFTKKNATMADDFFDGLRGDLVVESREDPVEALRVILLKDSQARDHLTARHKAALCIKAWNFWREGKAVKALRFVATGATREPFPVIK